MSFFHPFRLLHQVEGNKAALDWRSLVSDVLTLERRSTGARHILCFVYVYIYIYIYTYIFGKCFCRDGYDKIAELKRVIREVSGPRVKKVGVSSLPFFWVSCSDSSIILSGEHTRKSWKQRWLPTGDSDLVPSQLQPFFSQLVFCRTSLRRRRLRSLARHHQVHPHQAHRHHPTAVRTI